MPLSKFRRDFQAGEGELATPPTGDLKAFEVFIQLEHGKPPVYAGSVDAADLAMALTFARDHYGRDQPCVGLWVAPRDAFARLDDHQEVIWRLSDQSYRQARGYYSVRDKWLKFRKAADVATYAKDDLKQAF